MTSLQSRARQSLYENSSTELSMSFRSPAMMKTDVLAANQSRLGTPRPDPVFASSVVKRRRSVSSLCAPQACPRESKPNNPAGVTRANPSSLPLLSEQPRASLSASEQASGFAGPDERRIGAVTVRQRP